MDPKDNNPGMNDQANVGKSEQAGGKNEQNGGALPKQATANAGPKAAAVTADRYAHLEGRYLVRHPSDRKFKGVLCGLRFAEGLTATDITSSAADLQKAGCDVIDRTTGETAFKHADDED